MVSRLRWDEPSRLRSARALRSRCVHRLPCQTAAHRSWLHTRQSPYLLHPCRLLPDRIQEAWYHRGMKRSESWRSCLVSCGTSIYGLLWNSSQRGLGPCSSYCTVSKSCQCTTGIPARILKNQTDVKNPKAGRTASAWHRRCCAIVLRFACRVLRITERCVALMSWKRTSKTQSCATFPRGREFTWNGMDDIIDRTCGFSTRVEL